LYRKLGRPVRLLLVEDNPSDVMLVQYGLDEAEATYTLQVAGDGDQAVDILCGLGASLDSLPDLIFLDLNLPKRSGHEVLTFIKADDNLRLIPVVVLSSSLSRDDIVKAYSYGANSYLQKPADIDGTLDLLRTVEHYWLDLAVLPVY
jgi:two-component system, chemotaxis family, response regulator Rcp1